MKSVDAERTPADKTVSNATGSGLRSASALATAVIALLVIFTSLIAGRDLAFWAIDARPWTLAIGLLCAVALAAFEVALRIDIEGLLRKHGAPAAARTLSRRSLCALMVATVCWGAALTLTLLVLTTGLAASAP